MTTIMITGINSGMGFVTTQNLLKRGFSVIGTVRDRERSRAEITTLEKIARGKLSVYDMNLASLQSVKRCADHMREGNTQIDVFIFNAGIMIPPYSITEDGFESQFQVNYLSHYYLFTLLKDLMLNSKSKKVISISSLSSEKGMNRTIGDFEQDSRCEEKDYDAMKCYRESKLAQVLFSAEVHNRFSEDGFRSYAVHPGVVNTNLFYRQYNPVAKALIQPIAWLGYATGFLKTPEKGAETALYLATNDVQPSGLYWANKKIRTHNPIANDKAFLAEFWEWSAKRIR